MLDSEAIGRVVRGAGYAVATPLAVGVSLRSGLHAFLDQGDASDGPFDAASVAYAGSLAKQVTGACAALLMHEGTLDLEAPVVTWLPELPSWARGVRIRHLIHHTAAFPDTETVWERMQRAGDADWTSAGVLSALSTIDAPEHRPGERYAYSNVGYICLGRIVERISGHSLEALAHARLFVPLKMHSTMLWSGPAPNPSNAAALPLTAEPAPLSVGDGGLWTSVRDLLLWNDALLADALGISETMHTPGRLDDGTPLDYAWGVRVVRDGGLLVQSHGGSWQGVTSKLVRLPERGASFAALALDGSVARMVALSEALQSRLDAPNAAST